MQSLLSIVSDILKEQIAADFYEPQKNSLGEQDENREVVEFPPGNFVVSFFDNSQTIQISPIDSSKPAHRIRSLINDIRKNFNVVKVVEVDMNIFELHVELQENFEEVKDFIRYSLK